MATFLDAAEWDDRAELAIGELIQGYLAEHPGALDAAARPDQQVGAGGMSEGARLMRLGRDIGYWAAHGRVSSRLVEARGDR